MTGVGREAAVITAAPAVVEGAVVPVAGDTALLGLQLHQALHLKNGGHTLPDFLQHNFADLSKHTITLFW